MARFACYIKAGVAQLAEHQPSKLRVAGSIPVSRSIVSTLRLPGLKDRSYSGLPPSTSLRASSERRSFTPPSKAGVQLSSSIERSTELTPKSQTKSSRRSLGVAEWVKMIWLINFPIYLASLSYSIGRFFLYPVPRKALLFRTGIWGCVKISTFEEGPGF